MSSKRNERLVKRKATEIIKKHGAYSFMPVTGGYGNSGLFDEVICLNGYFIGVEYKARKNLKPTALQIFNSQQCRDNGQGITLLIHDENLDLLDEVLEKVKKLTPPDPALNHWPFDDIPEVQII